MSEGGFFGLIAGKPLWFPKLTSETQSAHSSPCLREPSEASDTTTTVKLDTAVQNLANNVGNDDLGPELRQAKAEPSLASHFTPHRHHTLARRHLHGNVSLGSLGADLVHGGGSPQHEQTSLLELHARVSNVALDLVVLALELSERALSGVAVRKCERGCDEEIEEKK